MNMLAVRKVMATLPYPLLAALSPCPPLGPNVQAMDLEALVEPTYCHG